MGWCSRRMAGWIRIRKGGQGGPRQVPLPCSATPHQKRAGLWLYSTRHAAQLEMPPQGAHIATAPRYPQCAWHGRCRVMVLHDAFLMRRLPQYGHGPQSCSLRPVPSGEAAASEGDGRGSPLPDMATDGITSPTWQATTCGAVAGVVTAPAAAACKDRLPHGLLGVVHLRRRRFRARRLLRRPPSIRTQAQSLSRSRS